MDQTTMLGIDEYARAAGRSRRTVERWLERGELPGATKVDGQWLIPAGSTRAASSSALTTPTTSYDVVPVSGELMTMGSPFGHGASLDEVARELDTSPDGVRRLAAMIAERPGLPMYVGRWGRRGSLRVWIPA